MNPAALLELRGRPSGVPTPLFALVAKAQAVAEGRERGPARLRLRDELGSLDRPARIGDVRARHAEPDGGAGDRERQERRDRPIIFDAYSLSPREREVLGAIARGASTAEIAAELFLSSHTSATVKTVFEKVGVSSRGELVARLFAEHYAEGLHALMAHVN